MYLSAMTASSFEYELIDFGEGKGPQLWPAEEWRKTKIANNYLSNGEFIITLVVEAAKGCRDTFIDTVFIPGPIPRFDPISPLTITRDFFITHHPFSNIFIIVP